MTVTLKQSLKRKKKKVADSEEKKHARLINRVNSSSYFHTSPFMRALLYSFENKYICILLTVPFITTTVLYIFAVVFLSLRLYFQLYTWKVIYVAVYPNLLNKLPYIFLGTPVAIFTFFIYSIIALKLKKLIKNWPF
jgi:hypothetical protein